MRTAGRFVTAVASAALAGCGTTLNVLGPIPYLSSRSPYGGVAFDVVVIGDGHLHPAMAGLALDLPLSLVGDTLTLPLVLALNAWRAPSLASRIDALLRPAEPSPETPRGRTDPDRGVEAARRRADQDRLDERARARTLRRALSALQHPRAATSPR